MKYPDVMCVPLPEHIKRELMAGNFEIGKRMMREYLDRGIPDVLKSRIEYEFERIRRLRYEFPYTTREAYKILAESIENFRENEMREWLESGFIDNIVVNGERYFHSRFLDNLCFLCEDANRRRIRRDTNREYAKKVVNERVDKLIQGATPKRYEITAGIKIKINKKIPENEKYRVWLPVPRVGYQQENVKILSAKPDVKVIADETAEQRTAYFESKEREFKIEFSYEINESVGESYAIEYNRALEEKPPHILFTPFIKELADRIAGDVDDPLEKAWRIYRWITTKIRYTYVREYGTYENIPQFAASSLRGDCGVQALLFITLCRAVGVKAKWQSGWFVTPKFAGPHDWAQVFVEDRGWMPVDLSFGNARKNNPKRWNFYFGNLDAFRMIANDDIQSILTPNKKFWRSDPVDNQRGEIEWSGGNIYYDEFEWSIYVKSFRAI